MSRLATQQAVKELGGATKAARRLGVSRQAIYNWLNNGMVPIGQIILVERMTGIPREDLRPDIYGAPRPRPRNRGANLAA